MNVIDFTSGFAASAYAVALIPGCRDPHESLINHYSIQSACARDRHWRYRVHAGSVAHELINISHAFDVLIERFIAENGQTAFSSMERDDFP